MSRFSSIFKGWLNYFKDKFGLISPSQKELFESRLATCKECEHNYCGVCTLCGCPVMSKTKSLEEQCPDNRWEPNYYLKDWEVVIITEDIPPMLREQLFSYLQDKPKTITSEKWEAFLEQL